jgi:hypothetical protein
VSSFEIEGGSVRVGKYRKHNVIVTPSYVRNSSWFDGKHEGIRNQGESTCACGNVSDWTIIFYDMEDKGNGRSIGYFCDSCISARKL